MGIRSWAKAGWIVLVIGLLTACGTYVPKGSTVVAVKNSKREYDRADLRSESENLGKSGPTINMRWYDTNTFITTATLTPGLYKFRARSYEGAAVQRDIQVVAGQDLYEFEEVVSADKGDATAGPASTDGPEVKGKIAAMRGGTVAVLFIGNDIIMRTTQVTSDGQFAVKAPVAGQWKVEVHKLGNPPQSWVGTSLQIDKPTDIGLIALK